MSNTCLRSCAPRTVPNLAINVDRMSDTPELHIQALKSKELDKELRASSTKLRRKVEFRAALIGATSAGCMHPFAADQAQFCVSNLSSNSVYFEYYD